MAKSFTVGYCRPPKHSQFKKGKSGNPKGRRRGTRNLKTDLEEELRGMVAVSEGGRKRRLSKQQIMVKTLFGKVAQGDVRAMSLLFNMILKVLDTTGGSTEIEAISADDQQVIESFLARHAGKAPKTKGE